MTPAERKAWDRLMSEGMRDWSAEQTVELLDLMATLRRQGKTAEEAQEAFLAWLGARS